MADFHQNGKFAKGINASFIVLISSLYKIIFKTLALRLCKVLDTVISEISQHSSEADKYLIELWHLTSYWMKPKRAG